MNSGSFAHLKIILVIMMIMSGQAFAQSTLLAEHLRDMPEIQPLSEEAKLDWRTISSAALGVSYTVRMPQKWEQDTALTLANTQLNDKFLTEIAHFRSQPDIDGQNILSISAMNLPAGTTLQEWVLDYWRLQGFTRVGLQERSTQEIELFYVAQRKGESSIFRARVMRMGNMIVMVRYIMPQNMWGQKQGQQKDMLDQVSISERAAPRAIANADFQHNFGGLLSFVVPNSWTVIDKDIDEISMPHATIRHFSRGAAQSITQGVDNAEISDRDDAPVIHLFYVEGTDEQRLGRAISQVRDYYRDQGYRVDGQPFEYIDNITLGVGAVRGVIEVNAMDRRGLNGADQELWLGILQSEDAFVLTSIGVPTRANDYFHWSRGTGALRKLTESVTFLDD